MNEKEKELHWLPMYCKHPGIPKPVISLESEKMIGEDEEMNEPLKVRQRIMSEILE